MATKPGTQAPALHVADNHDVIRVVGARVNNLKDVSIDLPKQVTLTITEADPVMKGGTAAPSYKSAVLENGLRIQVPPFVGAGERIVVATEDGSYVRRAE